MLIPTTTAEPPNIAYLTRSWDNLSSESLWEVAWRVIERCDGSEGVRGRGGGSPQHHDACIRGRGDADANHHFRDAKHRTTTSEPLIIASIP